MKRSLYKRAENMLWANCPIPEWDVSVRGFRCKECSDIHVAVAIDFNHPRLSPISAALTIDEVRAITKYPAASKQILRPVLDMYRCVIGGE